MRRVLLVKLGAIGDAVMLLPAAAALHAAGTEVEWLCGRAIAPLLALYPFLHPIVADEAALLRGSPPARARALTALWRSLAGRRYDQVATLYYDRRYRLLTATARTRTRLSFSATDRASRIHPSRHHTDEYARILLDLPDDVRPHPLAPVPPPRLPPSPLAPAASPRITLVPAGAHNLVRQDALRRWPVANFVAVAQALLTRSFEVVLAGGPGDRWASAAFAALPVTDCIGQLSLTESLGLFHASEVVVTPDTGPLHLAALTAASVVAIFGPTSPHSFLPRRPGVTALWGGEGFACRPCYDGKDYPPCRHNTCVEQVSPAMVLAAVITALAARRSGSLPPPAILTPPSTILPRPLHA